MKDGTVTIKNVMSVEISQFVQKTNNENKFFETVSLTINYHICMLLGKLSALQK